MKLLTTIMFVALSRLLPCIYQTHRTTNSTTNAAVSGLEPSDAMLAEELTMGFPGKSSERMHDTTPI